jgi:hypothetical protein
MRLFSALVLGALLTTSSVNSGTQQPAPPAEPPSQLIFPAVSAYALNKSRVSLPADFAGQTNLLLLSFEREQDKDVNTWLPPAKELQKTNPSLQIYLLPIFTRENLLYRWWENSSLRSSTSDPEWLDFTIPLYVDKPRFLHDLKIPSDHTVVVLLVDKSGKVLWRSDGPITDEKKAALTAALAPASPSGGH